MLRLSPALAALCVVPLMAAAAAPVAGPSAAESARLKSAAQRVTILRDKWGIPHVYGKTDADAVFGLMYAQAEDDFKRSSSITSTPWAGWPKSKARPSCIATCA